MPNENDSTLDNKDVDTTSAGAPDAIPTPTDPDGAPADTNQEPNPAPEPGSNPATDAQKVLPPGSDVSLEQEVTIYARMTEPNALSQADSIEEHVQIEQKTERGTKQRVRLTTNPQTGEESVIFTTKVPTPDGQGDMEHNVPVSKDFMEVFRLGASREIKKTRYRFKAQKVTISVNGQEAPVVVPDVGFEVDVFHTTGSNSEWVKVDLEIQAITQAIAKQFPEVSVFNLRLSRNSLPIGIQDAIIAGQESPEEKDRLGELWETEFAQKLDAAPQA